MGVRVDHLTDIVDALLDQVGFTGPMGVYMQDYGGPIGNRLIARHPDWLDWQLIQNANGYEEGFTEAWDGIGHALWVNRSSETEAPLEAVLEPETVKAIYTTGHRDLSKISPDNWNMDLHFLARPHAHRVRLDVFYDYRTNAELYPEWQARLRESQPLTLIFWGQGDVFSTPAGGQAYLRDLPDAEFVPPTRATSRSRTAWRRSLPALSASTTIEYRVRVTKRSRPRHERPPSGPQQRRRGS